MITIQQEPFGIQPVNTQHIWTIYDTEYTGYTNYKYVVDLYIDPYEEGWEKIGRIKLRPNSYGKGSFDAKSIIYNYINPNPRVSSPSKYTTTYDTIVNKTGFTFTNYLNNNSEYETLRQVANYRILIGKEYTSGGTTTIDITTDYWIPTYFLQIPYPTGLSFSWFNANGWEDLVSPYTLSAHTWNSGYTWTHESSGGIFIDGGSSLLDSGSYLPGSVVPGDIFWIYSNVNGCGRWYVYDETWTYGGLYSQQYEFEGCYDYRSQFKTIWLGAPNSVFQNLFLDKFVPGTSRETEVNNNFGYTYQFYNDSGKPYTDPFQYGIENQPWSILSSSFLNTYGMEFKPYNLIGATGVFETKPYFFTRKHHYDCPIILNWFSGKNGAYKNTYDFLYEGTGSTTTNNDINFTTQFTPLSDGNDTFTPSNELIQSFVKQDIPTDIGRLVYMISDAPGPNNQEIFDDGLSMGLVFDLYGDECLEDPVHFLFINRHGGFDTYTFGQKNIRSHSTSVSTYAQNGITNTSKQSWSDNQMRNTPYDQTTFTSVECQSTFVSDNDVNVIQDLYLSPYVWRIQRYRNSRYLVPIQITSNSVEEYKSRYNKLYQYDLTFTYNPINQFNNPL